MVPIQTGIKLSKSVENSQRQVNVNLSASQYQVPTFARSDFRDIDSVNARPLLPTSHSQLAVTSNPVPTLPITDPALPIESPPGLGNLTLGSESKTSKTRPRSQMSDNYLPSRERDKKKSRADDDRLALIKTGQDSPTRSARGTFSSNLSRSSLPPNTQQVLSSPMSHTLPATSRGRGLFHTLKNIANPFANPIATTTKVLRKADLSGSARQPPSPTKRGIAARAQASRTPFRVPTQKTIGPAPRISLVVDILDYHVQENGDIQYEVKYQGMRPRWVSEKRLAQDDFKKLVEFREKHEIEDTRKHAARPPLERSDAERRAIGE
jgi:hypothetical protein